jgi:hypothetical protein
MLSDQNVTISPFEMQQLKQASAWGIFSGIVYLILAGMVLLITVFIHVNLDLVVDILMNIVGMSNDIALKYSEILGNWQFVFLMSLSSLSLFLNGYFLIRFSHNAKAYLSSQHEKYLEGVYQQLGHYFILTTLLSIVSTILTVAAILYYMIAI